MASSGVYTPTLTLAGGAVNATLTSLGTWKWQRIGNIVHVIGKFNIQIDAGFSTDDGSVEFTLPFAPSGGTFADAVSLTGPASSFVIGGSGQTPDQLNNGEAVCRSTSATARGNVPISQLATYPVLVVNDNIEVAVAFSYVA